MMAPFLCLSGGIDETGGGLFDTRMGIDLLGKCFCDVPLFLNGLDSNIF